MKTNRPKTLNRTRLVQLAHALALPAITFLGLLLRLWDLCQAFIGDKAWNEVYYAYIARNFLWHGDFLRQYDVHYGAWVESSPFVPWLASIGFSVFGTREWAARLPMLGLGMLAVPLVFGLTRILYGRRTAVLAALLASTAPGLVFYSRTIQLDGPMTTLGLAAILSMLLYRRERRATWLLVSLLCFALSAFAKYTAILFLPAISWCWFEGRRPRLHGWRSWLGLGAYVTLAMVPALSWLLVSQTLVARDGISAGSGLARYLLRHREWTAGNFASALLSLWPKLAEHFGMIVWYPTCILAAWVLLKERVTAARVSRYALPLLLGIPWFLQLVYPRSWVANEYYLYPSVYASCIIISALWLHVWDALPARSRLRPFSQTALAITLVLFIVLSNAWDYRTVYRSSYYPWPLVTSEDPFLSAREVERINQDRLPVLADTAFTLYYTEARVPEEGRSILWHAEENRMIEAIKKRDYHYVVFTYPPTVSIMNAIHSSGYEQIAPAAWRQLANW